MTKFEEAKELYPNLMENCCEINFNAAYDWAEMLLKPGKKKEHAHYIKDFLHKNLKVYTMRDHFSAIMLMLGYKEKPEKYLNSYFFYIDKDISTIMLMHKHLINVENNPTNYNYFNVYEKRKITVPLYVNFTEWRKLREKYTELESYKLYQKEYEVYFK